MPDITPGTMPGTITARTPVDSTRAVLAAILGNAMEFYDFTVYAAFAVFLGRAFFPARDPTTSLLLSIATFGVGFIARPLGGILIGAYADRRGRKPAMVLTIWLMALGSGAIGVLPTYAEIGMAAPALLVLARLAQGFSAGGEMGPATSLLLESAPPGRRGLFGSWQMASQHMGQVISGALGLGLATCLPPGALDGWGWRVPFLLGTLIAPLGHAVRRRVHETLDAAAAPASMGRALAMLAGEWRRVALCVGSVSGVTVTQYFFLYATSYAINDLGLSRAAALAANVAVGATGVAASVAGGLLADRYGLKAMATLPRLAVACLMAPGLWLVLRHPSPVPFAAVLAALMALHGMAAAAGVTLIPLAFPAPIRTVGLSVAYALGVTLFGGTAQIVFTAIIRATGSHLGWVWYVVGMDVLCLLATWRIRQA